MKHVQRQLFIKTLLERCLDETGKVTREKAYDCIPFIEHIRDSLLKYYPKTYTRRLRTQKIKLPKHAIGVLRSLLNYHGIKLVSHRKIINDKNKKRSIYTYHVLGCI